MSEQVQVSLRGKQQFIANLNRAIQERDARIHALEEELSNWKQAMGPRDLRIKELEQGLRAATYKLQAAIEHLVDSKSGHHYDLSWCRPKTLTRQEINACCEQAYHQINAAHDDINILLGGSK